MKGVYPKLPSIYSTRLAKVIDMCLKIDPTKRPSAKQLLRLVEEAPTESTNPSLSQINLLNTIKVPKNFSSWKQELPKSDYDTMSEKPSETYMHPKFGHISQSRLR